MKEFGFLKFSLNKEIELPHSIYYGAFDNKVKVKELSREIWETLKLLKLRPKRLLGGRLTNWIVKNKRFRKGKK
jgi:hypothetical protein